MYCIKCGKNIKEEVDICPFCGEPIVKGRELTYDETHSLNKALHDREHRSREETDNSLVFIVLGATLLIIGLLFLFLSNKMDMDTFEKHISIKCFEFWVSMAGLSSGGVLFILGIVRFIRQKVFIHREIMSTLTCIQNGTYKHEKDK